MRKHREIDLDAYADALDTVYDKDYSFRVYECNEQGLLALRKALEDALTEVERVQRRYFLVKE